VLPWFSIWKILASIRTISLYRSPAFNPIEVARLWRVENVRRTKIVSGCACCELCEVESNRVSSDHPQQFVHTIYGDVTRAPVADQHSTIYPPGFFPERDLNEVYIFRKAMTPGANVRSRGCVMHAAGANEKRAPAAGVHRLQKCRRSILPFRAQCDKSEQPFCFQQWNRG
jgi:hypothetical protein